MAMTLVSTTTVGAGGAASIEFTGLAGTGKDLLLVLSGRAAFATSARSLYLNLNGSTTASWTSRDLKGNGTTPSSGNNSGTDGECFICELVANNLTSNTFSATEIYITNYAGSTSKSISINSVYENNAAFAQQYITSANINITAAATSVKISLSGTTFVQHSTASLYIIS